MGDMNIDELKRRIRQKRLPSGASVSVEDRRRDMEAVAFRVAPDIAIETLRVGGREAERLDAPDSDPGRAVLYLHGGGYVMGSVNTHRSLAAEISRAANARVYLPDYRLAPEAPFPAAVEDAVAAYEWLLEHGYAAAQLAVAGDSAGGGLTVATLVALRDRSLPLPAAGVCISPWSDLTCSAGSYTSRAEADPMVEPGSIAEMADHYLQGADPRNALASPAFADLKSLPPLLIHVGRDEVLFDDAISLHEQALACDVDSTLEAWDDMIHVWHAFHPLLAEGRDGVRRVGEFLRERWAAAREPTSDRPPIV